MTNGYTAQLQIENRKQQEKHKKQNTKQNKSFVKTATAFETSALLAFGPTRGSGSNSLCPADTGTGLRSGHHLGTGTASVNTVTSGSGGELRRRKPTLSLRLPGSFLLRFADRQFLALLFQLPPRITWEELLTTASPYFISKKSIKIL